MKIQNCTSAQYTYMEFVRASGVRPTTSRSDHFSSDTSGLPTSVFVTFVTWKSKAIIIILTRYASS